MRHNMCIKCLCTGARTQLDTPRPAAATMIKHGLRWHPCCCDQFCHWTGSDLRAKPFGFRDNWRRQPANAMQLEPHVEGSASKGAPQAHEHKYTNTCTHTAYVNTSAVVHDMGSAMDVYAWVVVRMM